MEICRNTPLIYQSEEIKWEPRVADMATSKFGQFFRTFHGMSSTKTRALIAANGNGLWRWRGKWIMSNSHSLITRWFSEHPSRDSHRQHWGALTHEILSRTHLVEAEYDKCKGSRKRLHIYCMYCSTLCKNENVMIHDTFTFPSSLVC